MSKMTTITWGDLEIGHVVKGGLTVVGMTDERIIVQNAMGMKIPYKLRDPWEEVEVETLSIEEVREFFNATPISEEVDGEVRYFAWPKDEDGFLNAAQSHLSRQHDIDPESRSYAALVKLHDDLHAQGADHTHIDRKD